MSEPQKKIRRSSVPVRLNWLGALSVARSLPANLRLAQAEPPPTLFQSGKARFRSPLSRGCVDRFQMESNLLPANTYWGTKTFFCKIRNKNKSVQKTGFLILVKIIFFPKKWAYNNIKVLTFKCQQQTLWEGVLWLAPFQKLFHKIFLKTISN